MIMTEDGKVACGTKEEFRQVTQRLREQDWSVQPADIPKLLKRWGSEDMVFLLEANDDEQLRILAGEPWDEVLGVDDGEEG